MAFKPGQSGNAKGRPKGAPNKATADIKAVASQYTEEAVNALAVIMRTSESDAAKVAAIKELLDRGHGKSPQSLDANVTGKMVMNVTTGVPRGD